MSAGLTPDLPSGTRSVPPTRPRIGPGDAAVLVGGAVLTIAVAAVGTRAPLVAGGLLLALALGAVLLLGRRRLARISVGGLLTALVVSLPLLALLGPSFALPVAPQAFLFRCLLYTSPSPRDRTRHRMPSSACKQKNNYREQITPLYPPYNYCP